MGEIYSLKEYSVGIGIQKWKRRAYPHVNGNFNITNKWGKNKLPNRCY